jgi:hypothetical protein
MKNLWKVKRKRIHASALKHGDGVNTSLKDEVAKQRRELLDLIRLLDTL